ncbi:YjbF family lipoprotein (plasmid) [Bacillus velezensis]|nr:YjbF family lipoprotein [Bacillus velezensis]QPK90948.1 YjbF family lipoprotein [Bacillus velezensis]
MNNFTKTLCSGLILAGLSACGPLNQDGLGTTFLNAGRSLTGIGADDAPAVPAISPAVANAAPGDVLLVKIIARDAVAPMTKVAQNGRNITWISPGQVTMAFEDGILVGTRGLDDDLMGVDPIGVRAALNAGGGTAQRRQSFLTSEDQIATRDLTCDITRVGREDVQIIGGARTATKFEEDCKGPALEFKNTYWLAGGEIIRSRQAVSAGVGFIQADQL